MSKYKVGDVVKVKDNLKVGRQYGRYCFIEEMKEFSGKKVTIIDVCEDYYDAKGDYYDTKENGYRWSDDMFEEKIEKIEETSNTYFPEIAKMLGV